ncbi:hypothetical protein YC2023_081667 [Brassica napus]
MDGTRGCISVDSAPMEGTEWKQRLIDLEDIMELDTHEHFERAGRSDTCFGELDELSELSDTTLELDELSDTNLELNELNDTEDGAGLAFADCLLSICIKKYQQRKSKTWSGKHAFDNTLISGQKS